MSVYLFENQLVTQGFSSNSSAYSGKVDFVIQDEVLLTTGNRGIITGKKFPWTVLQSATPDNVPSHMGFNLSFSIYASQSHYGDTAMKICVRGDLLEIMKHVFDEVPTTMGINLKVGFRFANTNEIYHVLASETLEQRQESSVTKSMGNIIAERLFTNCSIPSLLVTIELFGKDWVPACLTPDLPTTPMVYDDFRTRNLNKKLLDGGVHTDFVLVAENAFEMPCHKGILQLSSPFFERMLQTDCQEIKENKCQLNLSQNGLKALLEFLYFSGIEAPAGNSGVAMELLQISHELQIAELEIKMKELLIGKPDEELDLDGALQLFLRCTKLDLDGYDDMKEKAMNVIKKKKKELRQSATLSEMMKTNPNFGMEFLSFFI